MGTGPSGALKDPRFGWPALPLGRWTKRVDRIILVRERPDAALAIIWFDCWAGRAGPLPPATSSCAHSLCVVAQKAQVKELGQQRGVSARRLATSAARWFGRAMRWPGKSMVERGFAGQDPNGMGALGVRPRICPPAPARRADLCSDARGSVDGEGRPRWCPQLALDRRPDQSASDPKERHSKLRTAGPIRGLGPWVPFSSRDRAHMRRHRRLDRA